MAKVALREFNGTQLGGGVELMRFNRPRPSVVNRGMRLNEGASWLYDGLTIVETGVVTEDLYRARDGLILCPTKADLGWGGKKVKDFLSSSQGEAEFVDGLDPDIPTVDSEMRPIEDFIHTIALGYPIDLDELALDQSRSSAAWSRVERLDRACDRGIQEKIDVTIRKGAKGVRGMFQNKVASDLPGAYQLLGAGGGNYLLDEDGTQIHFTASLTAAELADAMLMALQRLYERSDKQIMPNRLAIPLTLRNKASRMRLGDNNDSGASVLQYVAENSDFLDKDPSNIVGVSSLSGFFPKKGSRKATDAIIPYEYNPDHVRCRVMTPRRHSIRDYPFGQFSIWAGRMTPVQWLRPIACAIYESDPNYSA